jgi:formate-dependent nitrite reductase membrane component NrfD
VSGSATDVTRDSYYGRPILKAPVWTWEIPLYFFFGGMAGAAAPFAVVSELRGDEALARRAWLVRWPASREPAAADLRLGRPERSHTCCACSSRPRR